MANIDINRRAVIEAHVEACRDAVLSNALELGRWLMRARDENIVPHGEWEEWVRAHAGMSERSAQRLMQAAREIPEGSPLERLGVAKIEALLMLPPGEREEAAREMGAERLSSRQVWREVRERTGTAEKSDRLDPGETLRIAEAAKAEAKAAGNELAMVKTKLQLTEAQLKSARKDLELERKKMPQVVEKLPDDYMEIKNRLTAAEKEADRLADELDRAKLGAAKDESGSAAARILAAIGAFLAEAGAYPEQFKRNAVRMSANDWTLVLGRAEMLRNWVELIKEAAYDGQ